MRTTKTTLLHRPRTSHTRTALTLAFVTVLTLASSVAAHHSFSAVYDQTQPVRVAGVVVRVDWVNPHARLQIESPDQTGSTTIWTFEMGAPRVMTGRLGWSTDKIKAGDHVVVEGFLARNGDRLAAAQAVTTASGERLTSVLPFR